MFLYGPHNTSFFMPFQGCALWRERAMRTTMSAMSGHDPWYMNAVFYEMYVDGFAGDFRGLTDRLDYLERLGVTCVWLLPHYPSPMVDDGYDVSDYKAVRPELGTLSDFDAFVSAAHARGIRVLVDLVLNHTSTEHPWFIKALSEPDCPEHGYYLWSSSGTELADSTNVFDHLKPSNWIPSPGGGGFYFSTFYPQQADLDWDNPAVLDEFLRIMDFWLDRGVDGFRVDAITHLAKREGTKSIHLNETHDVLRRIRAYLDERHPHAVLLGEANGRYADIVRYFGKGDECHMLFHFPLMTTLFLSLIRNEPDIARSYAKETADIPAGCQWATVLRNHDELTLKFASEETREEIFSAIDPDGQYLMKRDMGTAVRLATAFNGDPERIGDAFELLFSMPGSPVIYMGDEIGIGNVPAPGPDVRRTGRAPMDWERAEPQTTDPGSLFSRVARLARERRRS